MLTLAQIEQYHEDGYLIIEDYFPLEDMERLLQVARADQALADNAADRLDAAGRASRLSLRFDLPDSAYSAYARHLAIVEPMEQLVGEEVYDRMVGHLERASWVPVEHPTLRRGDAGRG